MKKIITIFFLVLLMHCTVCAGEKTLYDISQDTISLVEAYTACADPGAACTEGDARAMQSAAKNSLADLRVLIASGNVQRMMMTADEARMASERIHTVREQFVQIELFDAACNQAILFVNFLPNAVYGSLFILYYVIALSLSLSSLGVVLQTAIAVSVLLFVILPAAIIGTALILCSFVLLAPCLFWWL
jgi:membrane-bound ClpP family serine protease